MRAGRKALVYGLGRRTLDRCDHRGHSVGHEIYCKRTGLSDFHDMLANMEPFRRSEKSTFFGSRQALGAIGDSVAMAAATQPSIEDIHQTILFVEDEKHQAMLMGGFLQKKGFRLLIACDGVEAVEIHRRHKDEIAAVIMDMSLPKLSGWEAFLSMKKIQPEITTIFATGYITPEERLKMINQGAVDIIQKPYLPDQLLQQIRTALGKRA